MNVCYITLCMKQITVRLKYCISVLHLTFWCEHIICNLLRKMCMTQVIQLTDPKTKTRSVIIIIFNFKPILNVTGHLSLFYDFLQYCKANLLKFEC